MQKVTLTVDIFIHSPERLMSAAELSDYLKRHDIGHIADMLQDENNGTCLALRAVIRDREPLPGCEILTIECNTPLIH